MARSRRAAEDEGRGVLMYFELHKSGSIELMKYVPTLLSLSVPLQRVILFLYRFSHRIANNMMSCRRRRGKHHDFGLDY